MAPSHTKELLLPTESEKYSPLGVLLIVVNATIYSLSRGDDGKNNRLPQTSHAKGLELAIF
jgi:hypothetical protein